MTLAREQAQRRAIATLAMMKARGAVKDALKRQRVRLADVDAKVIASWAKVYLDDHPELFTEVKQIVDRWHFGPRGGLRTR